MSKVTRILGTQSGTSGGATDVHTKVRRAAVVVAAVSEPKRRHVCFVLPSLTQREPASERNTPEGERASEKAR